MNESMNQNQRLPAGETLWKRAGELIRAIVSDPELDFPVESALNETLLERDRAAFAKATTHSRPVVTPSAIERWVAEYGQRNWLARIQERLNAVESSTGDEIRALFLSLRKTMETLTARMVPAPVYRDAAAVKEFVYPPRRRAIEPADLPAFSPLFCTAADPGAKPFMFSCLVPSGSYRFSLYSVLDPDRKSERTYNASPEGTLEIDVTGSIAELERDRNESSEFVWFLREFRDEENAPGAWTSGLVWLESETARRLTDEAVRLLADSAVQNQEDQPAETLLEISLLASRGYLMKAFDLARRKLIFSPSPDGEAGPIPYKESLWQLVNTLVEKILARVESADPAFRRIQPDWNAAESLRLLRNRLTEWE